MPSFSSLFTSLTGGGFYYEKSPRHASYNFNQESTTLYRNQPRFPFEYYIDIKLNKTGTSGEYISKYFNNASWAQIAPLVKSVEMPSMKIESTIVNQYNRKRVGQSTLKYEPIKMVFHDVVDGKTLKFWDMYYRYYFADGNEAKVNMAPIQEKQNATMSVETLIHNLTPQINPNIANLPGSIKDLFQNKSPTVSSPTNTNGQKNQMQNIITDTLDNHNFGFNLPVVQNARNLIQTIDIYQVHAGRFNRVTLVNPRISAFTHDVLNYAHTDKTLELTFTFEYEYVYYTIQNMKLGGSEENNGSTINQYTHGDFLELPALAFNAQVLDFIESNNPLLQSDNPILQGIGKNVQASIGNVTSAFISDKIVRKVSSSVSSLANTVQLFPKPYVNNIVPTPQARPFKSAATPVTGQYQDINRASIKRG